MDFRKCPACQASVLDDDAQDCPFCGASMSGKPKPGKPATAATATAGKATAEKAGGTARSGESLSKPGTATTGQKAQKAAPTGKPGAGKGSDKEEDPFDVDTSAVRRAIKLAPRPTKTRTYEILCPMCETPGFLVPEDAGKDVQCCNTECIVPIFKSKRPKVEAPVEVEKNNKKLIIGGGVAAVCLLLGIGGYLMFAPPAEDPNIPNLDPVVNRPRPTDECDNCPPVAECDECKPQQISLDQILKESFTKVAEASRERGRHDANVARQLVVETLAVGGNLAEAQTELKRLQAGGRTTAYLQVLPYAEIAWTQLAKGDQAAAEKTAREAISRTADLPPTIRKSLDAVARLAAVLLACGLKQEAASLIDAQISQAEGGFGDRGVASTLWRSAFDSRTLDLGREAARPYHLVIPEALHMSVVATLVAQGYPDPAWEFIARLQNSAARDACYAAWAGRLAEVSPGSVLQQVEQKLASGSDKLTATSRTRIWAAVAAHLQAKQQTDAAKTALDKAYAAAETIPAPVPERVPNMKQIYDSQGKPHVGLSNPADEESAAFAWCDLAVVSQRRGETEQALQSMQKSMDYLRATTLSPARTQELYDECQTQEQNVRSRLEQVVNVGNTAQSQRTAFNRYRLQCQRLNDMAQQRFGVQVALLKSLAESGLRKQVWELAKSSSAASQLDNREPFVSTSTLPGLLLILADMQGETEFVADINAATSNKPEFDAVDRAFGPVRKLVKQKQYKQAAEGIRAIYRSQVSKDFRDRCDVQALAILNELQQTRPISETFDLITTITDPEIRIDAMMLLAMHTVKAGKAPDFWDFLQTPAIRQLAPLEKEAVYRGFATQIPVQKRTPQAGDATASLPTTMPFDDRLQLLLPTNWKC